MPRNEDKPPAKTPWTRKNPNKGSKAKMTDAEITRARERAEQAGRRYPNLIDNMAIMKERKIGIGDLP